MREKILKAVIYSSGFICLIVFLSVRIMPETSMNLLMKVKTYEEYEDSTEYGELFYITLVEEFKEDLPPAIRKYRFSEKHPALNEAEIIIYGDSHFDHSRFVSFPELLSGALDKKVYYYRINKPFWGNAPAFLETQGYKSSERKLFIYGSTERYISQRFMMKYEPRKMDKRVKPHRYLIENVFFPENAELLYSTLLKRSYLTHDIQVALSTSRFRLFDYISSFTPEYYLDEKNGSWLFIKEGIDHSRGEFTDKQIKIIAENIKHMADLLDKRYNLDFLFIAIPERSAVYARLTGGYYNNFLVRLYKELDRLDVDYVPLFEDFRNSSETVFHKTDTHWNENGATLGLNKTLQVIYQQKYDTMAYSGSDN